MNARINLAVLKTSRLDSGALSPLAMVVHQFGTVGTYHVGVHRHGRSVADTHFRVDEAGPMQLNIDLAGVVPGGAAGDPDDCDCKGRGGEAPTVSPRGYVLFHASSGDGYAATVAADDQQIVFDSTTLGAGDLFAASLLEPATYDMKNTVDGATGQLDVSLTADEAKRLKTAETLYVDCCDGKQFAPTTLGVISSQGLVFRVQVPSRIVITRQGKPAGFRPETPVRRWAKPRGAAVTAA